MSRLMNDDLMLNPESWQIAAPEPQDDLFCSMGECVLEVTETTEIGGLCQKHANLFYEIHNEISAMFLGDAGTDH